MSFDMDAEFAASKRRIDARIDRSYRDALRHIGVDPYYEENAAWASLKQAMKDTAEALRAVFGAIR